MLGSNSSDSNNDSSTLVDDLKSLKQLWCCPSEDDGDGYGEPDNWEYTGKGRWVDNDDNDEIRVTTMDEKKKKKVWKQEIHLKENCKA